MFATAYSQIGVVVMTLVCTCAIWRGPWPLRLTGVALFLNWVGCAVLQDRRLHHHAQPEMMALDVGYDLLLLVMVIVRRDRWPVIAFAYQTLTVLTHVAARLDPSIGQWDFFVAYYIWSDAMLLAVASGVLFEANPPGAPVQRAHHPHAAKATPAKAGSPNVTAGSDKPR